MPDKEAMYYEKKSDQAVQCFLCPHRCLIRDGKSGICGARKNENGTLFTLNYGKISGNSMDPIEKKPLYHFHPGKPIYSVGTIGCNLKCPFCQNYQIARYFDNVQLGYLREMSPQDVVDSAIKSGSFGIAYTYSEPSVWMEFVLETAKLSRNKGLKNVMVTNGFIESQPLEDALPYIDAANIDLKAFTEESYRRLGGRLEPILKAIEQYFRGEVHIELTTLIVPKLNDNEESFRKTVDWIAALSPKIPYHLSRYHPSYQYREPATGIDVINRFYEIAKEKLHYVYRGNVMENGDTVCPHCGNVLVNRSSYTTRVTGFDPDSDRPVCKQCGNEVDFKL